MKHIENFFKKKVEIPLWMWSIMVFCAIISLIDKYIFPFDK